MKNKHIRIIEWSTGDDTGLSSQAICRYMLGIKTKTRWHDHNAPSDASDRGRCIRLLNLVPEWWDRIDEMRGLSQKWSEQITLIKNEK